MSTAAAAARPLSSAPRPLVVGEWALLAAYLGVGLLAIAIGLEWVTRPGSTGGVRDLAAPLWTILVGVLCNTSCAILGSYLVLRRMSLLGDAISHAVLPGIVLAFLFSKQLQGPYILLGAIVLGVLTSFLAQSITSLGRVSEDASLGIVFTSLFAVGVVLLEWYADKVDLDVECVLYGEIERAGVTLPFYGNLISYPILTLIPALLLTVAFTALFWKELALISFDPALAAAMGFRVAIVHYLLMAMVSGVTVASFESVGSILVVAMLIVPAASAALMSDRLVGMMAWAIVIGIISAGLGYVLGAALNTSVAGMMAVVAGGQFALAVFLSPRHGLISRWLRNLLLAVRIASEDVVARLYRTEETGDSRLETGLASGVKPPEASASALVRWLARLRVARHGWIATDRAGGPRLTDAGRAAARNLVRGHRLWETYLDTHFDLPRDHLHDAAERMEHFLDPKLQAELDAELAGARTDPHGKVIPPAA